MSVRERALVALGVIGVAAVVVVPFAHRNGVGPFGGSADPLASSTLAAELVAPTPGVSPSLATRSPEPSRPTTPRAIELWNAEAVEHRGADGQEFDYVCPPNGLVRHIWGTDLYTDDSSVCTAAVHAGRILRQTGGTVRIVIRPGQATYQGSTRNGISSESYAVWDGEYEFVPP